MIKLAQWEKVIYKRRLIDCKSDHASKLSSKLAELQLLQKQDYDLYTRDSQIIQFDISCLLIGLARCNYQLPLWLLHHCNGNNLFLRSESKLHWKSERSRRLWSTSILLCIIAIKRNINHNIESEIFVLNIFSGKIDCINAESSAFFKSMDVEISEFKKDVVSSPTALYVVSRYIITKFVCCILVSHVIIVTFIIQYP